MRLKTFSAANVSEAMLLVKKHLGDSAIILSTQEDEISKRVSIIAGVEDDDNLINAGPAFDMTDEIIRVLSEHGTPAELTSLIVEKCTDIASDDITMVLAGGLDSLFLFNPLEEKLPGKPIMLVGVPGVGKTVTTAKMAARSVLKQQPISLMTTDTEKTGAIDQLNGYSEVLKVPLKVAHTTELLAQELKSVPQSHQVFIDTAGINPFVDEELKRLKNMVDAAGAEPVLVMPSGGDPSDTCEITEPFAKEIGCKRLIITRVDISRRLGSILTAAQATRIGLAHISVKPHIVDGLTSLNPVDIGATVVGAVT